MIVNSSFVLVWLRVLTYSILHICVYVLYNQTAWIMKNRSHSIVLNHLIKPIMEHHQTRWYEVLKIIIGNWVDIVGTTKEVPTDFM
jgi:hypothetical protein